MKRLLFILSMTITTQCFSQIEVNRESSKDVIVGQVKNGAYLHSQLMYTVNGEKDTTYAIFFRNAKYETLSDFQYVTFTNDGGTLDTLYNILKSFFTEEHKKDKDYKVEFKLGKDDVTVENFTMLGKTSVMFWTSKGYFYINDKQVDKLFGKLNQ